MISVPSHEKKFGAGKSVVWPTNCRSLQQIYFLLNNSVTCNFYHPLGGGTWQFLGIILLPNGIGGLDK